jgi:hypothetical protein
MIAQKVQKVAKKVTVILVTVILIAQNHQNLQKQVNQKKVMMRKYSNSNFHQKHQIQKLSYQKKIWWQQQLLNVIASCNFFLKLKKGRQEVSKKREILF